MSSDGSQSELLEQLSAQMAQTLAQSYQNENSGNTDNITLDTTVNFQGAVDVLNKFALHKATYCDQEMIGAGIPEVKSHQGMFFINVTMGYIGPHGSKKYTVCQMDFQIPYFSGKVRVGDLPVQPVLEPDVEEGKFIARGIKFSELTQGPKYSHASGYMYVPKAWGGFKRLPIDSRIVVDPKGYQKYCSADRWHSNEVLDSIPEEMMKSTLPTVPVFSLEYRTWGEVPVESISEIVFDDSAFDRVILSDEYKNTVSTLVKNFYKTECTDFIAGKKMGLVFLLNGNPGTGKTLTAQSIAEMTHRPLYCIGSGDLGTKPHQIEKCLENIFNMVGDWNGIVLIDEADVFMSKRTDYELEFNSCISVFLRLVESYFGILFLTTNRDHSIDPAFDSRIHIKLKYKDLDEHGRAQVWLESLKRYKIESVDIDNLKKYELNNREIANIVQLAYIQAGGKPDEVNSDIIKTYVNLRMDFQ